MFCHYVTIMKSVDGFFKEAVCVIPNSFGSCQNQYQGNIYTICKLKLFSV